MTASTDTASTATLTDADVVRAVFQAFADADADVTPPASGGGVRSFGQLLADPAGVAAFWA